MARQKSPFPFEGCIGDLLFYTTKAGFAIVQGKGGPSRRRVREAPEFARTRENAAEFGHASATAKLLRDAFNQVLPGCESKGTHNRLVQTLVPAIQADATRPRGGRRLEQAALDALGGGFEWNEALPVGEGPYYCSCLVDEGLIVSLPADAPVMRHGGVVTLAVVSFMGRSLTRPVAVERVALLPGDDALLTCPLPLSGLWVAGLGVAGPEGAGMVLLGDRDRIGGEADNEVG